MPFPIANACLQLCHGVKPLSTSSLLQRAAVHPGAQPLECAEKRGTKAQHTGKLSPDDRVQGH